MWYTSLETISLQIVDWGIAVFFLYWKISACQKLAQSPLRYVVFLYVVPYLQSEVVQFAKGSIL